MALININMDTRPIVAELKGIRAAIEKSVGEKPSDPTSQKEVDALTKKLDESSNVLDEALQPAPQI